MMNKKMSKTRILAAYLGLLPLCLALFAVANSLQASEQPSAVQLETASPVLTERILAEDLPQKQEEQIFEVVEVLPQFPGGQAALMGFLAKNLKYPAEAAKKAIQGRVIVHFVVEKDGSITDPQIKRGVDPLLDAEALRIVKLLPKFEPGKQAGKAVRVKYVLPISFKLSK